MNNNNLLIGLVLGFVLGNDNARRYVLNTSGSLMQDMMKEMKPKVEEIKNTLKGDESNGNKGITIEDTTR